MLVRDVLSYVGLSVGPGHSLREAADAMCQRRVGAAVVLDPDAPGPVAFADRDRVRRILGESGFTSIAIDAADVALPLASSGDLDTATRLIVQIGPVARALTSADTEQRRKAEAAVTEALAPFDSAEGVRLPARIWVVSAAA